MIAICLSLSSFLPVILRVGSEPQEPPAIPEEPGLPLAPGPILEFKGAWPFDTQSVLEVTPDGTRAFVAEGASVAILDLASLSGTPPTPAVITRVPLENAAPLAMRYYKHPVSDQSYLFVAGGTMGLWRMSVCPSVLVPPPAVPSKCICALGECDPYFRVQIELVHDPASFQRKRCINLAIVEGNTAAGSVPLLCALFTARASFPMPLGPTEMRTYKLNSDGTVIPYGNPVFFGTSLGLSPNAVGTSIVADPGDPNSVYVSMGIGWLYRVDLTTSAFTTSLYGPAAFGCPLTPCTGGEQMRDIAVVMTPGHGSVLYAALDYGRVLEYQGLPAAPIVTAFPVSVVNGPGQYPSRIQAISQGEQVLLTLGLSKVAGTTADTSHILTTGGWTTFKQSPGLADPNGAKEQFPVPLAEKEIRFYKRDLNIPAQGLSELQNTRRGLPGATWGSLVLRELSPTMHRVLGSPLLKAFDVSNAFGASPAVGAAPSIEYKVDGQSVTDGAMSLVNSRVTYFGLDGASRMMVVDSEGHFEPVEDARLCSSIPTIAPSCGVGLPNPFIYASVQALAQWRDPDGVSEWFVAGSPMWRWVDGGCNEFPAACQPTDYCGAGPYWWRRDTNLGDGMPNVGWFVVRMKPGNIGGSPPSAMNADLHWWQLYSPPISGQKAEGHDYISSVADPRTTLVNGIPQPDYIHTVRTGSNRGLKVYRRQDLLDSVSQTCGGASPGEGEVLSTPKLLVCETHVEIETDEHCLIRVPLGGMQFSEKPRNLFNNKSEVFDVPKPGGGVRTIIAVTQGWVAAGPWPDQPVECTWDDYYGRAMVAFYDITSPTVLPYPPPQSALLAPVRVGLSGTPGHAWAVKAKTYPSGDTFAFVADFTGRLLIFRVNYTDLFTGVSPYHPSTALSPAAIYRFPGDPSDILGANCIDLDLEEDTLYCALGRGGLGIVDVSNPYVPKLTHLIDTPGLVEGLVRRTIDNKDQLVIGDTRCGMRVYGRAGE